MYSQYRISRSIYYKYRSKIASPAAHGGRGGTDSTDLPRMPPSLPPINIGRIPLYSTINDTIYLFTICTVYKSHCVDTTKQVDCVYFS